MARNGWVVTGKTEKLIAEADRQISARGTKHRKMCSSTKPKTKKRKRPVVLTVWPWTFSKDSITQDRGCVSSKPILLDRLSSNIAIAGSSHRSGLTPAFNHL